MTNEHRGVSPTLFNDWRHTDQFKRFVGFECIHCGEKMFFPRRICTNCGKDTYFLGRGIIKSAVEYSHNSLPSGEGRNFAVDVQMGEGTLLAGIKYHGRDINIGMMVEVRLSPNGNRDFKYELSPLPERKPSR